MFEQSILVQKRTSKPWSVLLSLAAELAGIGLLIVLPLIWAQRLPAFSLTKIAVWLPLAPTPPAVHAATTAPHMKPSPFVPTRIIVAPAIIPATVQVIYDAPPRITGFESSARAGSRDSVGVGNLAWNMPGPPERPVVKR